MGRENFHFYRFAVHYNLPKMQFNTSSWSVVEDANKAKLRLKIPKFSEVLDNTRKGQEIKSKQVGVGGSKFALYVYPKGHKKAEEGMLSAFLFNESDHDVEVEDFTITVEGGISRSTQNNKIAKNTCMGWSNFMRASDVGEDLNITVDLDNSSDLVKVEISDLVKLGLGEKLKQMGEKLEQIGEKQKQMGEKLEQIGEKQKQMGEKQEQEQQEMKNFFRSEIAKVKATLVPECPVCLLQLKSPKKIVQCLRVGEMSIFYIPFPNNS